MQQQQNLDFNVLLNGRVVYYTTSPYQAVCEEASVPTELIIKEHKGLSSPFILPLTLCSLHS